MRCDRLDMRNVGGHGHFLSGCEHCKLGQDFPLGKAGKNVNWMCLNTEFVR
jgi:hypothetical protein